ncbi:MAG: autotransporter domain-containing protein [Candidatus Scalindua sp.]|jgi:outer membrane autotransporter protein|nr:autotransporter domain-containing protein [Candidatus Scalindua sp.]
MEPWNLKFSGLMKGIYRASGILASAILFSLLLPVYQAIAIDTVSVGSFSVNFHNTGDVLKASNTVGTGTQDWTSDQKDAVITSLNILNNSFSNTPANPVKVGVAFTDQLPTGTLGSTSSRLFLFNNEIITAAELKWREEFPLSTPADSMDIAFLVNANATFSFGDGIPATSQTLDFQSVITHEVAHGLGITSSYSSASGHSAFGLTRYDSFLKDINGNVAKAGTFGDPNSLAVIGQKGDLFWTGQNANSTYGGNTPLFIHPSLFLSGSSISHLFNPGEIQYFQLQGIEHSRAPNKLLLDMFRDMGWSINSTFYDAFGPTFYRDATAINYSDTYSSSVDYVTGLNVHGNGNIVTHSGSITTGGTVANGIRVTGILNRLDITGQVHSTGDFSQSVYVTGVDNIINHSGTVTATGNESIGIFTVDATRTRINHSGTTDAGSGLTAIHMNQLDLFATLPNELNIMNGSVIVGDIFNLDVNQDAEMHFGYDYDNSGNFTGFDSDFDFTFNDDITGGWSGFVGAGTTSLNGTSNFTTLDILTGATLMGSGTIVGNVVNNGQVNPGNSIGTLTINGDYTHGSNAILNIEMNNTSADKLVVTGNATINGGSIDVSRSGTEVVNIETGDRHTVLSTNQVPAGTFNTINSTMPLLSFTDIYNAGGVDLVATRRSIADAIPNVSPSQRSVSNMIDTLRPNATGDLLNVFTTLHDLNSEELGNAMDQLSPEEFGNLSSVSRMGNSLFTSTVTGRMAGFRLAMDNPFSNLDRLYAYNESGNEDTLMDAAPVFSLLPRAGVGKYGMSTWVRGFSSRAEQDGRGGSFGFDYDTSGVSAGIDRRFGKRLIAGFGGGISKTDLDYDGVSSSTDINTKHFSLYGSYTADRYYVDAVLGYARNKLDTYRNISISDIQRTANSDHDSDSYTLYLGGGYPVDFEQWRVAPTASMEYSYYREESYTERGADSLNLAIDEFTSDSLVSKLGFRIGRLFKTKHVEFFPEVNAHWSYLIGDIERGVNSRFVNTTESSTVKGLKSGRDGVVLGIGIAGYVSNNISLFLNYEAEYRNDFDAQKATVAFQFKF